MTSAALGAINRLVPTAVLWTIPAVLVLEYVNFHDRADQVALQWTSTVEAINGVYMVLAPVAAGVGALAYNSVVRHRDMVVALPDGGLRAYATPTLVTAAVLCAVHLTFLTWAILIDTVHGVPGIPFLLPTVVVLAALVAASGFGALVARIGDGSRLAAPLAAVLAYGYEIVEHRVGPRLLSDFAGATESLLGLRQRADIIGIQFLWLISLWALLVGISVWGWRAAPRVGIGVGLWVCMVGGGFWVGQLGDNRFEEADVSWVCSPGRVEVCVAREYADELGYFAPRVARFATELTRLGLPQVPSTFRQITGQDRPASEGSFGIDHQAQALAYKVLESSLPCLGVDDWTNRTMRRADPVVVYLAPIQGGWWTPRHQPVTRANAVQAVAELACR